MKPDNVKITGMSITADNTIYGLGDDSNVYIWNKIDGDWKLHIQDLEVV